MYPLIYSAIFYHAFIATALGATCYFPSGDVAAGNVPCNNNTIVSNCCASPSYCLANGLCLVNSDTDTVEFGRGGCTDQTWQSPNCFQHCRDDPSTGDPLTNGQAVFECGTVGFVSQASYCCENAAFAKTACCSTPSLVFQLAAGTPTGGAATASTPLSPSSVSTSDPSLPSTLTTTTTSTSTLASISASVITSVSTSTSVATSASTLTATSTSSASSLTSIVATTALGNANLGTNPGPGSTLLAVLSSSSPTSSSINASAVQPAVSSVDQGSSQTTKIAVGTAVPVGILLLALLGNLLWNNSRNNRKIRDLQEGIHGSPRSWNGHQTGYLAGEGNVMVSPGAGPLRGGYFKPVRGNISNHRFAARGVSAHELDPATRIQRPCELGGAPNMF